MVISIVVQSQDAIDGNKTELQKANVDAEKVRSGRPVVQKTRCLSSTTKGSWCKYAHVCTGRLR